MDDVELDVVTGAFSHTGKHIAERLLSTGKTVRTLTGRPDCKSPFGARVKAFPFNFDKPGKLTDSLRGATTLYNTYWVRFCRGQVTFDKAAENSKTLIKAAEEAGVRRIVHISITNPSEDSPLPYFRGKALVEKAIMGSRLSYAMIRPTVLFGPEGVLINNIAWLLRRFPVFAIPGSGNYQLRPVFVEDLAKIAVSAGQRNENILMDAVGPEIFTYEQLVRLIAAAVDSRARIIHTPPALVLILAWLLGYVVKDVVITRDETKGLMSNLLVSQGPATAETRLSKWLKQNGNSVGAKYFPDLRRHYR